MQANGIQLREYAQGVAPILCGSAYLVLRNQIRIQERAGQYRIMRDEADRVTSTAEEPAGRRDGTCRRLPRRRRGSHSRQGVYTSPSLAGVGAPHPVGSSVM